MIRKSGWLIFLVLLGLVLALVYVFGGTAVRISTTYALEKAVGAEVNIDDVSLSLAPFALEVKYLQITDPHQPTHNSVSFARARAAVSVWPALLGYYVIDELAVEGLAFGAERSAPGKVFRGENATEAAAPVDLEKLLQLDLPDAEELLARANLQTAAKGKALEQQGKAQQEQLEALKAQLPDAEKLAQIQAEIRVLTESKINNPAELASKTEQLRKLHETLRTERDKLRQVQAQLAQSRDQLQQAVDELRQAAKSDWQQLKQLANISDGGLAPISQILLGDVWGKRIAQLDSLYRLVRPYLPESTTDKPAGEEDEAALPNRILPLPSQPYPNLWIKSAHIDWPIGGGEAIIDLQDITPQHHIINRPTRLSLDVQNLPRLASLKLDGDFAVLQQVVTNLSWQLDGFKPNPLALGSGENALNLTEAVVTSQGSLKLVDAQVDQQAQLVLQQPTFVGGDNRYVQQLAKLLSDQSQIPLTLKAKGTVGQPEVSVRSPLDRVVGDALLGEAKEKIAALETDLRARLDAQLSEQLAGQSGWLDLLNRRDGEAEALGERIEAMLNSKLTDVKTGAKDRLKDALRKRGSE